MENEKEFPLDALFCNNIKGEEPKLEVVRIPTVKIKQKTDQVLGEPMKPVFTIKELTPEVRQYMMNLVLAVSLASGLPTPAQADDSFAKYYNPPIEKFVKNCDYDKVGGINSNPEIACFEALEKQYDENFDKRMDERIAENQDKIAENQDKIAGNQDKIAGNQDKIAGNQDKIAENQDKIAEQDKKIAEQTAKIMELQFKIKDNNRKIAKLRVANKNNTGTYEENLAEIARLEENIRNMDRLIKGMQEFAK